MGPRNQLTRQRRLYVNPKQNIERNCCLPNREARSGYSNKLSIRVMKYTLANMLQAAEKRRRINHKDQILKKYNPK